MARRGNDSTKKNRPAAQSGGRASSASTSVAKVTEISADSTESFEHAIEAGVQRAAKTLNNIRSAWVKEQSVVIEDGAIARYRVILKLTFELTG